MSLKLNVIGKPLEITNYGLLTVFIPRTMVCDGKQEIHF